ncbi:MAG TPA: 23S rRNA (pseudouridine(1915)-N(3))-methyltransferase RlmH [Candidatus Polarisedimenticolaceae bacterium]
MRFRLLCVGRPRDARLAALHDDYAARIRKFGVTWDSRHVAEERPGGRFSDAHVREREARHLADAIDEAEAVVALDALGQELTSEELAVRLGRWAAPRAVFVVGGPLGLDPAWRGRATATWSLSRLTFPHELVRVIVAEQVYRALCITRGIPYHK